MSAQEPPAAENHGARPAGRQARTPRGEAAEGTPSVRDLLAACAAADAVSTPPRAPAPEPLRDGQGGRDAQDTDGPDVDDEGEPGGPDRRAAA
nr:hypothetical protein [Streptomyces huiliensis]